MSTIALQPPVARRAGRGPFALVRDVVASVREGIELASRYKMLAYLNDEELTALGLKREDIPRVVVSGWHR
jgi:uncharacterized protein YjiS (DUF1127 family)